MPHIHTRRLRTPRIDASRTAALLALTVSITAVRARAQLPGGVVIDQQSVAANGPPITISETFDFVRQTFTPTASQISGFGISFAGGIATPTNFNVLVGLANGSEEPLLSREYTLAASPTYGGFDAIFSTPATLRPGQLYVIALGLRYGSLTFATGSGDPYARGSVFVNGVEQPGQDLVFRTYAPAATSVAPEPATLALTGAGLVAGGAFVRRRHAR